MIDYCDVSKATVAWDRTNKALEIGHQDLKNMPTLVEEVAMCTTCDHLVMDKRRFIYCCIHIVLFSSQVVPNY